MNNILIIDSGVGGLSVLDEIHRQLPRFRCTYVADNAAYPYGTKQATQLVERVTKLAQHFLSTKHYDALVLACNTASTIALPELRAQLKLPIIGVVPAIKPAAQLSRSKVIALLATPGTVCRHYTQQLIDNFAPQCQVIKLGSAELVDLAEQTLESGELDESILIDIIKALLTQPEADKVDTIVLGCTHFPLLKQYLLAISPKVFNHPVSWIDSGQAVARQLAKVLSVDNHCSTSSSVAKSSSHQLIFTQHKSISDGLRRALKALNIEQIAFVEIK